MHCRQTTPLYKQAGALLDSSISGTKFAEIDCVDSGPFCSDLSVNAYPTLRRYTGRNGSYDEFVGSKNIAESVHHRESIPRSIVLIFLYIRMLSELTAGRVTLEKHSQRTNSIANGESPASVRGTSPDPGYLAPNGSSALVKLDLPDVGHKTSILLNFTISTNRHHLLLNGEYLVLLVPNPSVPPRLRAQRITSESGWDMTGRENGLHDSFVWQETGQTLVLDYDFTMNNRDDPDIRYYNYWPILQLNVLAARLVQKGAGSTETSETQPNYLPDGTQGQQKTIEVRMREQNHVTSTSPDRNFTIISVNLVDRPRDYKAPTGPKLCSLTSWRCADLADPPWYREVWYDHFDDHGRIGCMRRQVSLWWESVRSMVLYVLCPSWLLVVGWKIWRVASRRRAVRAGEVSLKKGILS